MSDSEPATPLPGSSGNDLPGGSSETLAATPPQFVGPLPPPYCRDCGFVVTAPAQGCGNCAAERPAAPHHAGSAEAPLPLPGTVHTAMGLYFLLLLSFLPLHFVPEDFAVHGMLIIELFDVGLVLTWTAISWKAVGPSLLRFGSWWWYPAMAALGVGTFFFATVTVGFVIDLFDIETFSYSDPFLYAGFGWGTIIFSIVIQPAVIEELAFRGIILGSLRSVLGVHEAVLVSALMFMVIHLSPFGLPYLLLLGLLLGYVRVKSQSIWPCILLHGMHNGLVLASEAWWGM